ncbi:hypothetical protein ACFVH6_21765 [Spirillospora sp. NPDC127200]
MRTYRQMGEAVAAAMQTGIDLAFNNRCLATRTGPNGATTDICVSEPGHDDQHRAWGSDNRGND